MSETFGAFTAPLKQQETSQTGNTQTNTEDNTNDAQQPAQQPDDDNNQPTTPPPSDEELITQAMATKHSKTVAETDLSINENDGSYAQGVVIFDGAVSGGWWLAAKTGDDWVIVADGNGVVQCDDLTGYSFPTSMVPECWDETTSSLRTL